MTVVMVECLSMSDFYINTECFYIIQFLFCIYAITAVNLITMRRYNMGGYIAPHETNSDSSRHRASSHSI